ncbi:MAG TPA: ACP S-malonyltransferase [Anaerolineales bacterium]
MTNLQDLKPGTTALVFPGQGSQAVGMGHDLAEAYPAARRVFDWADEILRFPLSELMWSGPAERLNETINTQPALFVHSMAAYTTLQERAPDFQPAFLAGHSLGELSALTAGGALAFPAALRLVRRRGELMKRAGEQNPGLMAAILNLDIPTLEKICEAASKPAETVQVANDNCPGQVVISGSKPAVERAMEAAKAAGARRAIPLAVSIAAHSALMASIQDEWNLAVTEAKLQDSKLPLIGNVDAAVISKAADLERDIQRQMQSRVRWTETITAATAQGIKSFIEVGSGAVLLGLIKRIAPDVEGFGLGTAADFAGLS